MRTMHGVRGVFSVLGMFFVLMFCLQTTSHAALISARDIDDGVDITLRTLRAQKAGSGEILDKAKALLVFPGVFKGAIWIGGEYGEGALRIGGRSDSYYNIADVSAGFSFGGEKKSIVIAFMTDDALKNFKEGSGWTIGGEGSLAVVTVGAGYENSVATANKPLIAFVFGEKGLMVDVSLNGAKVTRINPKKEGE